MRKPRRRIGRRSGCAGMSGSARFWSDNIWGCCGIRNWVVVWGRRKDAMERVGENMDMTLRSVASATFGEEADRVRLFAAGDRRSSRALARDQIRCANLSNFALQSCRTRARFTHVSSNLTCASGERNSGGQGEIRTHVPELPDHPISSRRRYDRFGTSPRREPVAPA